MPTMLLRVKCFKLLISKNKIMTVKQSNLACATIVVALAAIYWYNQGMFGLVPMIKGLFN